jgi:hypothetical protein
MPSIKIGLSLTKMLVVGAIMSNLCCAKPYDWGERNVQKMKQSAQEIRSNSGGDGKTDQPRTGCSSGVCPAPGALIIQQIATTIIAQASLLASIESCCDATSSQLNVVEITIVEIAAVQDQLLSQFATCCATLGSQISVVESLLT